MFAAVAGIAGDERDDDLLGARRGASLMRNACDSASGFTVLLPRLEVADAVEPREGPLPLADPVGQLPARRPARLLAIARGPRR